MASQHTAVSAYRALLKAQRQLFNADLPARAKARAETRMQFLENKSVSAADVPALVQEALDLSVFLKQNVAQTVRNERGNYEFKPTADHVREDADGPPPALPWEEKLL